MNNNSWPADIAAPIRPSAIWYAIAVVILVTGIAVGIAGGVKFVRSLLQPSLATLVVPGSATVEIDEPGTYMLCYEYQTVVDGTAHNLSQTAPPMRATVTDLATKQDIAVVVTSTSYHYAKGNRAGVSVFDFNAPGPGKYEVNVAYNEDTTPPGTPTVVTVEENVLGLAVGTLLGSIGFAFLLGLAALVTFIVTLVRRIGAKRRRLQQQPPPVPAYR